MDNNTEAARSSRPPEEEGDEDYVARDRRKWERPPSSYGSMKSDSEEMEEDEEDREEMADTFEEDDEAEEEIAAIFSAPALPQSESTRLREMGVRISRPDSPETFYTQTTEQTKPPGAFVIDTRPVESEELEEEEEELPEFVMINSPEPPEPIEPDEEEQDDDAQPGRLHPEQDLRHIYQKIMEVLRELKPEELFKFKTYFHQRESGTNMQRILEGDILDFVDNIIEILGLDRSLSHTVSSLERAGLQSRADQLRQNCKRALIRSQLKQFLTRKYQVIREGVVRAGKHNLLDSVYVEPEISVGARGGVDPAHELRPPPPGTPAAGPWVGVNDLFRLQRADGQGVRTVLTTGIPGIGMSVSVGKFCLDWAEQRANRDFQFVITLSFGTLWLLRDKKPAESQQRSIMDLIASCHPDCKDLELLGDDDCKFLLVMDCYDCYRVPLDWENAPVISDKSTPAHPDILIVNMIRGTLLPNARLWILGRQAAVSQIPLQFIDAVTEIQGFRDDMTDQYLTRRFNDAQLGADIVAHYKRLPTLRILARQPFICWMMATVFERCYRYQQYGVHPPRLTPFYINILVVQINRRQQFYYGKLENDLRWSAAEQSLVTKMGLMAFKMLEKDTHVFSKKDVKDGGMDLMEVTVWSGLCTELPAAGGQRRFCFVHLTVQEFMAALYVFIMFRNDSKSILHFRLPSAPLFGLKDLPKSAAGLVQHALERTLSSPVGHYDMFLRFLCGLLSPECHSRQLGGHLFPYNAPPVNGLDEAQGLLNKAIARAPPARLENLKECLREMTQKDE